jgi:hypothetical protein
MRKAFSKRKSALHKSDLADAALREALLKARLCRSRAQHAKHVLGATNVYTKNIRWAVQQYEQKSALSNRVCRLTTETKPGVQGAQCTQLFLWIKHH